MQLLIDITVNASNWLRPHLDYCALAILSSIWIMFGSHVHKSVRKQISSLHLVFRIMVFMLLCTFVYGGLLVFLTPVLAALLGKLPNLWLSPLLFIGLVGLGVLAEKRKFI